MITPTVARLRMRMIMITMTTTMVLVLSSDESDGSWGGGTPGVTAIEYDTPLSNVIDDDNSMDTVSAISDTGSAVNDELAGIEDVSSTPVVSSTYKTW